MNRRVTEQVQKLADTALHYEARCAALTRALEIAASLPTWNRPMVEARNAAREALAAASACEEEQQAIQAAALARALDAMAEAAPYLRPTIEAALAAAPTREKGQTLANTCPACNGPVLFAASCQSCGVAIPVPAMNTTQSS